MSHYKPYPAYKDSGVEWLGKVPEHWSIKKISAICKLRNGYPFDSQRFQHAGHPDSRIIRIRDLSPAENHIFTEEICPDFAIVNNGDILIGMDGEFNIIKWNSGSAKLNQRVCALNSMSAIEDAFVLYSLPTPLKIINDLAYSTTVKHLSSTEVLKTHLATPTNTEEMARIVTFLDRETTRIDTLIAKKTRFIELLKEKRQALITQAVTKGLNPNAKMKDSGVEWLGEVPEHWDVKPLKLLVEPGTAVTYGIVQPGEPLEAGIPFVQTTNMTSGDFSDGKLQFTSIEIASQYSRTELQGGEVLLGIRASIGAAYIAPYFLRGANISRGVARILCNQMLDPEFLVDFFRSFSAACYWDLSKQGSTFNEVSIATVKEIQIPVPPMAEQLEIVRQLKVKIARHEKLLYQSQLSITLLKERRSALITAAVTGQIDLREAA